MAAAPNSSKPQKKSPARTWPWAMLLVLTTAAAYSNSLSGEFILDDLGSIVQNPTLHSLHDALRAPQEPGSTTQGRPMLTLSLAANYALGGLEVQGYHLFNLAIHLLAALTLFGLAWRTLSLPTMAPRLRDLARPLGFAVALVWAVHPLTTAAVTYVVQRGESMAALFYLLTLYALLRGSQSPHRRAAWAWFAAATAACLAGMATKEIVASAPLAALLYDRAFLSGSFRATMAKRWGAYLSLAAMWIVLAALALASGDRGGSAGSGVTTPLAYAATQAGVVLHYLRLSFWPSPLCLDYDWPPAKSAASVLPGAIVLLTLLAATIWATIRRPKWGFLGAIFFLVLAPTSSFLPLADAAFEHRMYLPLAAVVAAVATGAVLLCDRLSGGRSRAAGSIFLVATLAVVTISLASATYARNEDYRTGISIWQQTLSLRPDNQRAHHCLGWHLQQARRFDEALTQYDIAATLKPDDPTIFQYRGTLLRDLGRYDEAIRDCTRAIELAPKNGWNYLARAGCYFNARQYDLAWADLLQCRKLGVEPPQRNVEMLQAVSPAPPAWNQAASAPVSAERR